MCFKSAGPDGLEGLEEGDEKDDGLGIWRWFGLVAGIIIVVAGLCCSVKLYGIIARPYR